jgi:hypothetical protein
VEATAIKSVFGHHATSGGLALSSTKVDHSAQLNHNLLSHFYDNDATISTGSNRSSARGSWISGGNLHCASHPPCMLSTISDQW